MHRQAFVLQMPTAGEKILRNLTAICEVVACDTDTTDGSASTPPSSRVALNRDQAAMVWAKAGACLPIFGASTSALLSSAPVTIEA